MTPCGDKRNAGRRAAAQTSASAVSANRQRNQKIQLKRTILAASDGMRYGVCDEVATKRTQRRENERDLLQCFPQSQDARAVELTKLIWRMLRCATGEVRAIIDTFTHVCKQDPWATQGHCCNFG